MLSQTEKPFGKYAVVGVGDQGFYLRLNGVTLHVGEKIDVLSLDEQPVWFAEQSIIEITLDPVKIVICRTGKRPVNLLPDDIIRISGTRVALQTPEQMSGTYVKFGKSSGIYRCGAGYRLLFRGTTFGEDDIIDIVRQHVAGPLEMNGYKIMKISIDEPARVEIARPGEPLSQLYHTDKVTHSQERAQENTMEQEETRALIPLPESPMGQVIFVNNQWVLKSKEKIAKMGDWIEVLVDNNDANVSVWHQPVQITNITQEGKVSVRSPDEATGELEKTDVWQLAFYKKPLSPVTVTGIPREFPPKNYLGGQILLNNNSTSSFKINDTILNVGDLIDVREKNGDFKQWREGYEIVEIYYEPPRVIYRDALGSRINLTVLDEVRSHEAPMNLKLRVRTSNKPETVEELERALAPDPYANKFAETNPGSITQAREVIQESHADFVETDYDNFGDINLMDFERVLADFENSLVGTPEEAVATHLAQELRTKIKISPLREVRTHPYTRAELRDATHASSFTIVQMIKSDVSAGQVASALIAFATDIEKLVVGEKACGFEK